MWRTIQKKILLPFKWKKKREKIIRDMRIRSAEEIYAKIEEIKEAVIIAQRKNDKSESDRLISILNNLLWITYGDTKF